LGSEACSGSAAVPLSAPTKLSQIKAMIRNL